MPTICPSVLASDQDQYRLQMEKVAHFAYRVQIDLTDGEFAQNRTVAPEDAWWPAGVRADFHLMFHDPALAAEKILDHQPNLIIVHSEAEGNYSEFAGLWRSLGVKAGVALLPQTPADTIVSALDHIDHVLIFSGKLGEYGGSADLSLLDKVRTLKTKKPDLEIGWDGGVNDQNVSQLALGGVDVFDVGGYIQDADDPERAYMTLERVAQESGTT